MGGIRIRGGTPLCGTLQVQGAKNAVLPLLAATLLTRERCTLLGCPEITDVHTALEILCALGCEAAFASGSISTDARQAQGTEIPQVLAGKMRSSVTFLGPVLALHGAATVPLPGGCALGARPLDLHLRALSELGVRVCVDDGCIRCRGRVQRGTVILRYPSVGATENLMLAGCGAQGPVTILGAAKEPEIGELAAFLNCCGAKITGAGTAAIRISGGPTHGCRYRVMPDRMAAASYLCAAAACGGCLQLRHVIPSQLEPVTDCLHAAGCAVTSTADSIVLRAGPLHAIGPVRTGPYPAFPTDAQAPLMAALLRAEGTTVFDETVFENRYRHVAALQRLGADITVRGSIASVRGVTRLHGARMEATDLRGGAAMLIAALSAEGESLLHTGVHLARGYERLEQSLRALGAQVQTEE